MDKKQMKKIYKECENQAVTLFRKCEGVLLVYIVMFTLIKQYLIFPLMNRIWGLVLSTMPNQFITNQNVFMLLRYPYVPLVGLLLLILFSFITAWEVGGILLCIEYQRQKKAAKLWNLLILSVQHVKHIFQPKNWMIFVFLMVIMPLTDLYATSGMLSTFSVPEYIADFLNANILTSMLFLLIQLFLIFLSIRWFYVIPGVLLYKKSFWEAAKESTALLKKRYVKQALMILKYALLSAIRLVLIPFLVLTGAFITVSVILYFTHTLNPVAAVYSLQVISPVFRLLFHTYTRIAMTCYYVVNYALILRTYGKEDQAELSEKPVKTEKIRTFHLVRRILMGGFMILAVLLYTFVSVYFTKKPESIKTMMTSTVIIAHKGYSSKAPENTMAAFDLCMDSPAEMIELDIRESKDGVPIVIHNADLNTAAGVKEEVYNLTFEELQKIPIHYAFSKEEFSDVTVPSLEEVLIKYGNEIPLLIEIKMDERTPDLPKKIVDLLEKYDCKKTCAIHSSTYEAIEKVKDVDPSIPCGFIIAMGTGSYEALPAADFFSVEHTFVNENMINKIHALDKKVYAWTVNNATSISAMSAMNIDGVITDVPDVVYNESYTFEEVAKQYFNQIDIWNVMNKEESEKDFNEGSY